MKISKKHCLLPVLPLIFSACAASTVFAKGRGGDPLAPFRDKMEEFGNVLTIPEFESSSAAIEKSTTDTLKETDQKLAEILKKDPKTASFDDGIGAIDRLLSEMDYLGSRMNFLMETAVEEGIRASASAQYNNIQKWMTAFGFREDVYRFTKDFSTALPKRDIQITGEQARLLEENLKFYKRLGMELSPEKREQLKALKDRVTEYETAFANNLSENKAEILFTEEELKGVPADAMQGLERRDGKIVFSITTADKVTIVMRLAENEETRRRMELAFNTQRKEENAKILKDVVNLRSQIANMTGYSSWAEARIEPKLAKKPENAKKFLLKLNSGLAPKLKAEMKELVEAKRKHLGLNASDPRAKIHTWDIEFYFNLIAKERYTVDREALRVYFPMEKTLDGMFAIYQKIFGLKFNEIEPPFKWVEDIRAFVVTDQKTAEPLGVFYLDLYPRPGKYKHFAHFGLIPSLRRNDGKHARPTAVLVCNFPKPVDGKPSLLLHDDVETLFHEFGHAMHNITSRAEYYSFSGTNVPGDFVEAPSQMLENWVWSDQVLDTFAADYRDPSKKFPPETLKKLEEIRLAGIARATRRQISFGLLDLDLHSRSGTDDTMDVVKISNQYIEKSYGIPLQPGYAFITRFGHLMGGYDAGYYGYLWAESISADMSEVFERSPGKFLDETTGMRLRNEVYAQGNARPIEESVRAFLGRDSKPDAFLRKLGLQPR